MASFVKIAVSPQNFGRYKTLTPKAYKLARTAAKKLRGKKVLHINSTAAGGGVAELLKSQVPLEQSLGIKSRWFTINPPAYFFKITKKMHNLLQGKLSDSLSAKEKSAYLGTVKKMLPDFRKLIDSFKPNLVIIHDPQPLPLIEALTAKKPSSILRIHIELSAPNPTAMEFLRPLIQKFNTVIFTNKIYKPLWLAAKKAKFVMPAIDPFSQKNKKMPLTEAESILALYNINIDKPVVSQISRFDPWKNPMGVINAYYIAKKSIPDLQLVLVGVMEAADDPEAKGLFKKVKKHAEGDPDIFLFSKKSDLLGVPNAIFINALQTANDLVIQKSIREGFGLTVTEAMWKGKAVVGGKTEGIMLQIKNNKNGVVVSSPEEAAEKLIKLIKDRKLRGRLGKVARKTVKKKFLMSRLVLDHLKLYTLSI